MRTRCSPIVLEARTDVRADVMAGCSPIARCSASFSGQSSKPFKPEKPKKSRSTSPTSGNTRVEAKKTPGREDRMATSQLTEFIQHLRTSVLLGNGTGLTDGQLLGLFVDQRDQAAFAALVKKHGPMVWGVCRRLLLEHDAEDAFQATFLVLVRRAGSVKPREMVGNWLYGVAHQTALKARAMVAKRKGRERQVTEMPEPATTGNDLWNDLRPLIDQELSRLPDKLRAVIILCDLEGKTRKEAARQLRCPEGTVASRLNQARTMLAKRLARLGLPVSGGALATVLSQKAASAFVPPLIVSSTIKAATLLAAGQTMTAGLVSSKVIALSEGVVKAMMLSKAKIGMMALLVVATAGAGGGGLFYYSQAATAEQSSKPVAHPPSKSLKNASKPEPRMKEPATVSEYSLLPVRTELQRLILGNEAVGHVYLDGDKIINGTTVDSAGIDLERLRKELSGSPMKKKGNIVITIWFKYRDEMPDQKAVAILDNALLGLGYYEGVKYVLASHTYGQRRTLNEEMDVVNGKVGGEAIGEEASVANKLVRVFPVQTKLSRLLTGDSDCVLDILTPFEKETDTLTPEVENAAHNLMGKFQVKEKSKLLIRVWSKGQGGRAAVERFVGNGSPSEKLANELGFKASSVTHSPGR